MTTPRTPIPNPSPQPSPIAVPVPFGVSVARGWRSRAACLDVDPDPIDRTTAWFVCVFGLSEVIWPVRVVRPEGGCMTFDELDRDVRVLRLSGWGRVAASDDVVPYLVVDPDGFGAGGADPAVPARVRGARSLGGSVRSYAYDLLRWWRFLRAVGVEWDRASAAEVRDFVLWLQQASKSRRAPRTRSLATAGQ